MSRPEASATGDPDQPLIAGTLPNAAQHKPVTVTKEWGAASPQLMKLDRPAPKGSVWIRTSQPWADCRVGARYPSAEAFAADLRALLDGSRVAAYREGPLERLGRFAGRHRTAILLVAAYLVMRVLILVFRGI